MEAMRPPTPPDHKVQSKRAPTPEYHVTKVVGWDDQAHTKSQKRVSTMDMFQNLSRSVIEHRLVKIQAAVSVLALFGLVFAIAENQRCLFECQNVHANVTQVLPTRVTEWCSSENTADKTFIRARPDHCDGEDGITTALKGLQSLSTVGALILIWDYYRKQAVLRALEFHVDFNRPMDRTGILETSCLWPMLIEILLTCIHAVPGVSFTVEVEGKGLVAEYRIEELLSIWMFARLYHFWKLFRDYTYIKHTAKRFASSMHTTTIDSLFILKSTLEAQPIFVISLIFGLHVVVGGWFILVAEIPVQYQLTSNFWNCAWFIVVTMTTTGYGDFWPITHVGRVVAVFAMISGTVLSAILTAAVYSNLSFDSQEYATMTFMQQFKWDKTRKDEAAKLIQNVWLHGVKAPRSLHCLKTHRESRFAYQAWLKQEPHFGKVMKEVVSSTETIEAGMETVMKRVSQLHDASEALLLHQEHILPPPGEIATPGMPEEQSKNQQAPTRSEKDLAMLLSEMESQKKLIEQLLRAVVFLSTSRSKDTDALRVELNAVRQVLKSATE